MMTLYVCPECQTEQALRWGQRWCTGCQAVIPTDAQFWEEPPALGPYVATPLPVQAQSSVPRPFGLTLIVLRYAATVLIILWSLGSVARAVAEDMNRSPGKYYGYLSAGSNTLGPIETAKILLPYILPYAPLGLGIVVVGLILGLTLWYGMPAGWLLSIVVALGDALFSIGGALLAHALLSPATTAGAVVADLAIVVYLLRPSVRDYFF